MLTIAVTMTETIMMPIRLKEMMLKTKMWLIPHAMTISTTVQTCWQTALAWVSRYSSAITWEELVSPSNTKKSTVGNAANYLINAFTVNIVSDHLSRLPSIPDQNVEWRISKSVEICSILIGWISQNTGKSSKICGFSGDFCGSVQNLWIMTSLCICCLDWDKADLKYCDIC